MTNEQSDKRIDVSELSESQLERVVSLYQMLTAYGYDLAEMMKKLTPEFMIIPALTYPLDRWEKLAQRHVDFAHIFLTHTRGQCDKLYFNNPIIQGEEQAGAKSESDPPDGEKKETQKQAPRLAQRDKENAQAFVGANGGSAGKDNFKRWLNNRRAELGADAPMPNYEQWRKWINR